MHDSLPSPAATPALSKFESLEPRRMLSAAVKVLSKAKIAVVAAEYITDVVGGAPSPTEVIKFRNTGTRTLKISEIFISGANASFFKIVRNADLPLDLKPKQKASISVEFNPQGTSFGVKTAVLSIKSNARNGKVKQVALRGLATAGEGGSLEPSLQRVLDALQVPVNVGDSNPDDYLLDFPAKTPNDEVTAQSFVKAGSGPVTISPLAMYAIVSNPAATIGVYQPGTPSALSPLFDIPGAYHQNLSLGDKATGTLSFNPKPGEKFGVYGEYVGFKNTDGSVRRVYSEDVLNSWDGNNKRHIRFYPMKNPDGSAVANAYLFAFEDFNAAYDNQDFIGVISNVKVAPKGAEFGFTNLDNNPVPDQLTFSKIQNPDPDLPNLTHDTAKIRINNSGTNPLTITNVSIGGSNPTAFKLVNAVPDGTVISKGKFLDVAVQFTPKAYLVSAATLTVRTNDPDEPVKVFNLGGYYQKFSEKLTEPSLAQIFQILGTKTSVAGNVNNGGRVQALGDEVLSPYWDAAVGGGGVQIYQLAAWHGKGNPPTFQWHVKGSGTLKQVTKSYSRSFQSVFPRRDGTVNGPTQSIFYPTGTFGIRIGGEWSDDAKNPQEQPGGGFGHHVRVFPFKGSDGVQVANTWLITMDYNGVNYDFNDNVFLMVGAKPNKLPAAPRLANAVSTAAGLDLTWSAVPDANLLGYDVYASSSPTTGFAKVNNSTLLGTEYIDSNVTVGTTRYYQVKTVNKFSTSSLPITLKGTRIA